MKISNILLVVVAGAALAACAEEPKFKKARADMTQREKDSITATLGLPGSGVVKKALSVSDAEASRAAMFDSASEQ
jgi:hypothetical protein